MDFKEIAAIATGAVTLLGFIGTWIKIGIAKGKSDRQSMRHKKQRTRRRYQPL